MTGRVKAPRAIDQAGSIRGHLAFADSTLQGPPKWSWQKRVEGAGHRVARFVLPLEFCKTSNARMRGGIALRMAEANTKHRCFEMMFVQGGGAWTEAPLSGRPMVRAVRFSSRETDVTSDWAKTPIDRLRVGKSGLGYIVDDSPRYCEVVTWCEYAPPGKGFVLVEVWTGTEAEVKS